MQPRKFRITSLAGCVLVLSVAASAAASTLPAPWKIALTSNREGDSEIYSMTASGAGVHRLTRARGFDGAGPFSPDGRKLLYTRNQGGVWVMNADGSGKRDLTPSQGFNAAGGWSPDGRKIVFTSNRDGNNEVYVMNADGSGQRNLLPSPSSDDWAGSWSPDGRTILFATDRDGNSELYAMNADGSEPRNLTHSPGYDAGIPGAQADALWSPDGKTIVFMSTRDTRDRGNPELYSMRPDGSGVRRLTRSAGVETPISWSPDGRRIAFARYPSKPRWAFYVMNANGSGVKKVTWALPGHSS
jgi:Tol biopolymer transport system component